MNEGAEKVVSGSVVAELLFPVIVSNSDDWGEMEWVRMGELQELEYRSVNDPEVDEPHVING